MNPADLPGVPPGTAVTNRTISFGAQPLFPPGIDGSGPGPFFDLFLRDTASPCSQGFDNQNRGNQSGIVFFPGSAPLYRDGVLIGGLGVSGDGVEQDDVVTEAGQRGFEAPAEHPGRPDPDRRRPPALLQVQPQPDPHPRVIGGVSEDPPDSPLRMRGRSPARSGKTNLVRSATLGPRSVLSVARNLPVRLSRARRPPS